MTDINSDRRTFIAAATSASLLGGGLGYARPQPPNSASDLVMLDAVALGSAIHSRQVSCVEVMNAYLTRIEKYNGKFNAIVALRDRSALLAEAQQRDAQLARGESMGALHGFPHAVKDLHPVRGIRTTMGSPILKDNIPTADSIMVERIRRAGAVFIGKTNTPEFGLGSHTYNPVYGTTLNAYDSKRSAGGSSGGAAVSLALRMLPLADGTDYGGSLRNPAGWNNVFGFRTSIGQVPHYGRDTWLPSMGVSGPMARTVTDLALLLSVQAGYDPRTPLSIDGDGTVFERRLDVTQKGVRIAWGGDFRGFAPTEPEVLEVCRSALKVFEALGCNIEEAVPEFDLESVWQATQRIRGVQQGFPLLTYYKDPMKRALLKPEAIYEIEGGLQQSGYDLLDASTVRTEWYRAVQKLFDRYDYLVVPTAQLFPFDANMHWPEEIAGTHMQTYHEWMKIALLITMTGCPTLAIPAGFSRDGLPIGLQLVAPNRAEFRCLQLGYAYQMAANWGARLPPALRERSA